MTSYGGTRVRLAAGFALLAYAGIAIAMHHSDLRGLIPAVLGGYLVIRGLLGRDTGRTRK